MKKARFTIITCALLFLMPGLLLSQSDNAAGSTQIDVPQHIQNIKDQIVQAETNENWEAYSQLRQQLIDAWQQINPEVAKLYRNVNDGRADSTPDGMPEGTKRTNHNENDFNELLENPSNSSSVWGDDLMFFNGEVQDISMDIDRDGNIYIAVLGRKDGSSNSDSVYVYKSVDGGLNWTEWSTITSSTLDFDKIELMCFDGQIGGSGTQESYLLFFYLFDNGWLRVGRTLTATPSWSYYTISGEFAGGYSTDFAVDRNNSSTNYRAVCVYDSSIIIKSARSEPTSYGTVWQDVAPVGSATFGRDLDYSYGWNGAVYVTFNGNNSGNLYAIENTDYADPTSWGTLETLVTGSTDTTRHAEIIATREDDPDNTVVTVYERKMGNTYDLYSSTKPSGGAWGTMTAWVTTRENKWPDLYSRRVTGNQVFEAVFEQSENGNVAPRSIRYKPYNGTSWLTSEQVSDDGVDVTGLQQPEVGAINELTAVYAFVGGNGENAYFDNSSWTPSSVNENGTVPEIYNLEQNYPNPFNPSTTIQFSIPENAFVSLKVFDVLGNEVAELVSEERGAGTYSASFNASSFSSGIYFYSINAGSFVSTKKMILIK